MSSAVPLVAALMLASANDESWAKFSAHQALSRHAIDVSIGTQITAGEEIYWFRRSVRKPGQKIETSQTDTRSCPRMLVVLRALRELPMPRPKLPFADNEPLVVTADGGEYSLTISVGYPGAIPQDLTLTSNVGTPLAAWVEDALATLDSCVPKK